MTDWFKFVTVGSVMAALGWVSRQYNWLRLKPKEAIDVKKIEQEIKSDQVTTAIEVTNLMLTRLTQAEARLTFIQDENDKLRLLIVDLRENIIEAKTQMKEMLNDLIEYLKTNDIQKAIKIIKEKYELND